ncbi:unnamed protein product [Mytilus coruscus]|uniref:Ig-like domain-containing protein n=1 Tax=Mytilus coruscus TaxID=42192 RepID=A0A6J8DRE2_MYTCO|nr:unnamed protein product [Mytilus coruscus]
MIQIKHVASYVCMLQVINRQLTGILAATVSINQNITRLLGTDNFDEKKPIAIFNPDRAAKLHPSGAYLSGRVILTNITHAQPYATMKFHVLKCTDEKDYMCRYNYYDMDGSLSVVKSMETRILVKVQVGDVHIKNKPIKEQYDRKPDNITLTCKASGDPEPTYIWFKEDKSSSILSRTNVFVIEDVIRNNSGLYICQANNIIKNIKYRHSSAVEIDIVYAAYAIPVVCTVVIVVICLAVMKRNCKREKRKSVNIFYAVISK